jgi:hypothetical protein
LEKAAYSYMLNTAREPRSGAGGAALARKPERFTLEGPETITFEYLNVRSAGMNKQGIGITHTMKSLFGEMVLPILQTREYTFTEKIGYIRGMEFSLRSPVAEGYLIKPDGNPYRLFHSGIHTPRCIRLSGNRILRKLSKKVQTAANRKFAV